MKKALFFILSLGLGMSFIQAETFAASGTAVAGFEIIAPTTAKVNEAIDITVRAIDKDKKTVTGYRGSIIFDSDNFGDSIPRPWKAIPFTAENNGEIKFSKGVTFKSAWKQKIYVYDVADGNLTGEATVQVEAKTSTATGTTETVTIITPENNGKVAGETVVISGKTRKNSKVTITLNGKEVATVSSDDSGVFTKSLSGITQENNILLASVVDANGKVIGTSSAVNFTKWTVGWSFYNLTITPGNEVEAGSNISFLVEADTGMKSVMVLLDNTLLEAKEWQSGKYTLQTVAPASSGSYNVDVTLTNATGQITKKEKVATLTVKAKALIVPSFKDVKVQSEWQKVVFTFKVENPNTDLASFKIIYGTSADNLDKSVTTYSTGKIQKEDGTYSWYIDNLEAKTYFFKIVGQKADWSPIDAMNSDTLSATIGKKTCTIGNVGSISVLEQDGKSILSWTTVTGALSYNVYKVDANGEFVLFQNTKENRLELSIASGAVKHDDFGIKALCDDSTESADYSKATGVKTGPGMIAILIILSGVVGLFVMRRRIG